MVRERDDTGQYVETVSEDAVLDVFTDVRGPVITSSDVADALDCTTEAARQKLSRLAEQGLLDRRKTGRTVVWWRTTPEEREGDAIAHERLSTDDDAPAADAPAATHPPGDDPDDHAHATSEDEHEAALDEAVREYIERENLPPKTAYGRDAVMDVFRELREHGTLPVGDLQDAVYPDYEDHWQGEREMWNSIERYFTQIPGIEKPGYGEWGYAGDDVVREQLDAAGIDTNGSDG